MEDEYELKKHIPDELLFAEILVRLPVKPLIAYKSVCKTWLYTIESRSFIEAHRRRHSCECSDRIVFTSFTSVTDPVTKSSFLLPQPPRNATDLVEMEYIPLEDLWLPPEMTQLNWSSVRTQSWEVSVKVLGLIRTTSIYCLVSYLYRPMYQLVYHDFLGAKFAICNPATRDYKLASPFPPEEMPRLLELAARRLCRAHYGFGMAADGDYKVVVLLICELTTCRIFLSYVYSLRHGAWHKIVDSENGMVSRLDLRGKQGFPYIYDNRLELCPQVFLNGCWHWIAIFNDRTWNVLTFNVDSETFKLVWGPPSYREAMPTGVLLRIVSVLNGHLALLYHLRDVDDLGRDVISVWMMMEYGDEDSWINVWRVKLKCYTITTLVGITYSLKEDGTGGIQIDRVLFKESTNKLVSCDEFGAVERQQHFDTDSCIYWNTLGMSAYNETLERLSPSKHGVCDQ